MTEDAVSNDLMPANKKQQVGGSERAVFHTIIVLNVRENERPGALLQTAREPCKTAMNTEHHQNHHINSNEYAIKLIKGKCMLYRSDVASSYLFCFGFNCLSLLTTCHTMWQACSSTNLQFLKIGTSTSV